MGRSAFAERTGPMPFKASYRRSIPTRNEAVAQPRSRTRDWRLKIVSVASAARPKNYLRDRLSASPSSLSSITGTILSSMRSLQISENSVSALTSSLSSRSKPPLKSAAVHQPSSLAPFGDRPPVALNRPIASSRVLVSGFKEKVSMNFIVLCHFLCVGPACQDPARRYAPRRTLMHPWRHQGDGRPTHTPTEMSVQSGEHSHAKNVLPLWNHKEEANAAAWRFGYSVGRRIIHTTLKTGVRPQRKSGKTKLGR